MEGAPRLLGGARAGGSVPAAAARAPGHRLRPLAFPLCQLFYFRLVAPRQGILSEPWETQKGGRWVCAAPARPSAALGCPPAPGRGAHPGWHARSPTRRSPFPCVTCPVENVPNLRPSRAPGSYPTATIRRRETLATAQACSAGLAAAVGRGWRAQRGATWEKAATGAEQEG